jgi:hypothetical protein
MNKQQLIEQIQKEAMELSKDSKVSAKKIKKIMQVFNQIKENENQVQKLPNIDESKLTLLNKKINNKR